MPIMSIYHLSQLPRPRNWMPYSSVHFWITLCWPLHISCPHLRHPRYRFLSMHLPSFTSIQSTYLIHRRVSRHCLYKEYFYWGHMEYMYYVNIHLAEIVGLDFALMMSQFTFNRPPLRTQVEEMLISVFMPIMYCPSTVPFIRSGSPPRCHASH